MLSQKTFSLTSFMLLTLGYVWLFTFNQNLHILLKYLTMQAYFLTWLYYLLKLTTPTKIPPLNKISSINLSILFQIIFIYQIVVTIIYWFFIHTSMINSKRFSLYEISWNIYMHVLPLFCLMIEIVYYQRVFVKSTSKIILLFYYLFALPVNILYSKLQRPVYKFLLYDDVQDYILAFSAGVVICGLHAVVLGLQRGWRKGFEGKLAKGSVVDKKVVEKRKSG